MQKIFLFLSLLAAVISQQIIAKRVVLSALIVSDLHEPAGDPEFSFKCWHTDINNPEIDFEILSVTATDKWFIIESELYLWDSLSSQTITCSVAEVDAGVTEDSLGTTQPINYNQITYDGMRFDTTNPAEASFWLRCGNCFSDPNYVPMAGVEKKHCFEIDSSQ